MGIKFNIKTSLVDKNFKTETVDTADLNAATTGDTAEVNALLEDMSGYETPGSSHVATPFDDYMVGDLDPEAYEAAAQTQQFARSVPSLEELLQANPKVREHLELVIDHYKRTEQKLRDYIKYLTDMMYTGQFNEREIAAATKNIENANVLISTCALNVPKAKEMLAADNEVYRKEFRLGDVNDDGWIGKPYAEGSLGVQKLDSGQLVYINPATGVAYDHPPYADTEYQAVIGRGYDIVAQDAEDYAPAFEGAPTADLEISVSDLNALQDSAFGTSSELFGVQYMWVKADDEGSFDPKLGFQKGTSDSTTDTEPHYELADFVMQDGQIVQETPEDMSKYVQVEIGAVEAYSREVDNGKGFVHYIEYRSADPSNTLVARVCIRETKTDSWNPAACSELYALIPNDFFAVDTDSQNLESVLSNAEQVEIINEKMAEQGLGSITESEWSEMDYIEQKDFLMQTGPAKVYASASALAFNTDKIDSYGMTLDFSGIKSTARLTTTIEQIEQSLGLTRPPESDEKAYRAYMENLSMFTEKSQMWAFQNHYRKPGDEWDYSYSTHDREWNWVDAANWVELERNFDSQGYASVYIDPNSPEARAQTFNRLCTPEFVNVVDGGDCFNNSERPITETQSSQITGVLVYGSGRPGHVVGTEYNDAVHVAEKNAKFDELKERFPWAEPIMPESAFNNTVIENVEVVRGYDANHYITGVSMAVIDGDSTSDNFIEAKAPVAAEFDGLLTDKPDWKASRKVNDRTKNQYTLPCNVKHYVHVDAGGTVAIDNADETNEIIDAEWMSSAANNLTAEYYHDDYYDIVSSTDTLFGNIADEDAADAVPSGLSAGINELGAEGEIGNKAAEMVTQIQTEREKTEVPDYLTAAAEEWNTVYGGATEEAMGEMNDFFGTAFGEADDLWSELEAEEAGEVMGNVTTEDIMNQ